MTRDDLTVNVSIIIVNYNTKQLLADCLNSIYEQTKDIKFEVIVSDNGSTDGSIEMLKADFPQVILIENNANLGFGAANNRGLAIAKGKYIFYLNSDTILLNNAVKIFFDYFEEHGKKENIGALGANLLDTKDNIILSCGNFPDYKKYMSDLIHVLYGFTKLTLLHLIFKKPFPIFNRPRYTKILGEVDYITGADLFLRNDDFAEYDENIFMYCEEVLLEWKLMRQNKKRILIDGPRIIHLEGASAEKNTRDVIHERASFSHIQNAISRIFYFRKTGVSFLHILILKIITTFLWLNPYLYPKTSKYIKKLWQQ